MYNNKPKLLDQLKKTLRLKHYSLKTEKSYGCPVPIFVDTETSMLDNNETGGPGVPDHVKRRRKYDREFKVQAVKLSLRDGKTVKEVAEDLGICP